MPVRKIAATLPWHAQGSAYRKDLQICSERVDKALDALIAACVKLIC